MDIQVAFNIAMGLIAFLGGWVVNSLSRSILRLEDAVHELPRLYVAREDYRVDMSDIKSILQRISDKLDAKADKSAS